jgi:sugar phosphate isomerase/epimerase
MKSTRTLPILKASGVVIWTPSTHKNQTQENQANDDNHFDGRQPELEFAKEFDAKVVDENDRDKEYRDEGPGVDLSARNPILDNQRRSGQVIRSDDDVLVLS